MKLRHSDNNNN